VVLELLVKFFDCCCLDDEKGRSFEENTFPTPGKPVRRILEGFIEQLIMERKEIDSIVFHF